MPTCPNGHETATTDFCDQCGVPMPADAPAAPPAAPEPVLPTPEACPHCGAPKPPGALFCEACGYDYTTGALPSTDLATALGLTGATPAPGDGAEAGDAAAAAPVDGVAAHGVAADGVAADDSAAGEILRSAQDDREAAQDDREAAQADREVAQADREGQDDGAGHAPGDTPAPADTSVPSDRAPAAPTVAEVWIDPDWYTLQESPDPLPPAGPPTTFVIHAPALIGRVSESRNIHPEVDCGADSGCSRRQAELTQIGGQWYVADLDSANGTFVAPAGAPLPDDPITAKTPVGPDDRIYVGAWTRIVVRPAAPGEAEALTA
ncbi:MAG: FHA domain-containing protein [Propionibacteriaceae bacterium]|nr:FHA domain-containing protein [Propionibacteriaceae bacterium]